MRHGIPFKSGKLINPMIRHKSSKNIIDDENLKNVKKIGHKDKTFKPIYLVN